MHYYSTNRNSAPVDFKTAAVTGQAPDKGLYYPEMIPSAHGLLKQRPLADWDKTELAFRVMKPYVGQSMPDEVLHRIVTETVDFPFPLVQLSEQVFSLELFHGPTLAFKDVGARFMSRCLAHFNAGNDQKITVLVATSGDTGGAVANGFDNVEGVEVIILYPEGKVSPVQELQLTTCGSNVHALAVAGSFDDCQAIVKQAFTDADLNAQYQLTSANSINVARWLPQQLYYFFALQQWPHEQPPVVSVPSGNFGNICAGMVAQRSGLPIQHFIAACNSNDTIPQYLRTGILPDKTAVPTLSNAMDVAKPSNFVRIMEMYDQDVQWLRNHLTAVSVSDATTRETIAASLRDYNYLCEPHGAVGLYALQQYQQQHNGAAGFFLETAHPVKFPDVVAEISGAAVPIPDNVAHLFSLPQHSTRIDADYELFKEWMRGR
ncbi:threonine synthase [Phnomibacter sp. MR]|uniref:threonine synthase n=1 Tax=Phnomibacter sp. MR TaxID=3042318 RepID=UPI003A7FBDCA